MRGALLYCCLFQSACQRIIIQMWTQTRKDGYPVGRDLHSSTESRREARYVSSYLIYVTSGVSDFQTYEILKASHIDNNLYYLSNLSDYEAES